MNRRYAASGLICVVLSIMTTERLCSGMSHSEKRQLREKVLEMFGHAYRNYMDHAYPADELMPLSCKGRHRGTQPGRGDVDDALGNFSLTLVDTLDTLVVLGQLDDFDEAVRLVIRDVSFDRDIVVSVFETNIRMLGGLLGGHIMATYLKKRRLGMHWYNGELLVKATDLGERLLPAFNTTTGIPYPRVNLRYGTRFEMARTGHEKDTCTACAGTMILEFAALSRLTENPIFEEKAHRAMEFLWMSRHRSSDLVGTVINIHSGDWVRRESGVGAGIDSYYEYVLKAYILLGDETYLDRFNKHYSAIMKYVNQGALLVDVHMHKPLRNSRNFMDALLAFWPGLQVLKGDIKPAIEIHEMLYQVTKLHNFLPEAFTTDFRVHWGQHPLRPEFVESTYFIHKATGDPYYLEVGKTVVDNLEKYSRVSCGFAAIKDVKTNAHEDQMDSFVMAETFKYLYLLFSDKEDIVIDMDEYIFTTEAHLLPLSLSLHSYKANISKDEYSMGYNFENEGDVDDDEFDHSCPNDHSLFRRNVDFAQSVRNPVKSMVENRCPQSKARSVPKLRAVDFIAGSTKQLEHLKRMGIRIVTMNDGRVQLLHTATEASSTEDAEEGMVFMQEMIELSRSQKTESLQEARVVQLVSAPFFGTTVLEAGPAQFGYNLKTEHWIEGEVVQADPLHACGPLTNAVAANGKIVLMERGDCMFVDKARQLETAGAIAGIVIDNNPSSTAAASTLFAMSGDGGADISIPVVFLFRLEAQVILNALAEHGSGGVRVVLAHQRLKTEQIWMEFFKSKQPRNMMQPTIKADSMPADTDSDSSGSSSTGILYVLKTPSAVLELTKDSLTARDTTSEAVLVVTRTSHDLPKVAMTTDTGRVESAWATAVYGEIAELVVQMPDYSLLQRTANRDRLATLEKLIGAAFKGAKLDYQLEQLMALSTDDWDAGATIGETMATPSKKTKLLQRINTFLDQYTALQQEKAKQDDVEPDLEAGLHVDVERKMEPRCEQQMTHVESTEVKEGKGEPTVDITRIQGEQQTMQIDNSDVAMHPEQPEKMSADAKVSDVLPESNGETHPETPEAALETETEYHADEPYHGDTEHKHTSLDEDQSHRTIPAADVRTSKSEERSRDSRPRRHGEL